MSLRGAATSLSRDEAIGVRGSLRPLAFTDGLAMTAADGLAMTEVR
jgi:hypothetical protein